MGEMQGNGPTAADYAYAQAREVNDRLKRLEAAKAEKPSAGHRPKPLGRICAGWSEDDRRRGNLVLEHRSDLDNFREGQRVCLSPVGDDGSSHLYFRSGVREVFRIAAGRVLLLDEDGFAGTNDGRALPVAACPLDYVYDAKEAAAWTKWAASGSDG